MPTLYPHQPGLMIAVPLTGRALPPFFTWAFANLHPPMNFAVRYVTNFDANHRVVCGPVDMLRNWYIEQAIEQECKYLFFLDEDVTVPGHTLRQLIFQMEHHPEIAVVGGIYCHKSEPHNPMVFRGNGQGPYWDWKAGEFFEISGLGMGATLIRVDAVKDIEKPYFQTVDTIEKFYDGENAAEQWTEDLYFCEKIRKAGWKIYADSSVMCDHWDMNTHIPARLPLGSKPLERPSVNGKKRVVDLGSGENPYQGEEDEFVVTVDLRDEAKADYRCDLRKLPFATGSFDTVYSSHTLEHFAREEVDAVLDEWVRILKPEGEIKLKLPNIGWAAERITQGIIDEDVLNVLYGGQKHDLNFHKVGFTPELIRQLLERRGFTVRTATEHYHIYVSGIREPKETHDA